MPLDSAWTQASSPSAGFAFCALGGMTNQIHQWAHMPRRRAVARALQAAGLLLRPREQRRHHRRSVRRAVLHHDRMVQPSTRSPSRSSSGSKTSSHDSRAACPGHDERSLAPHRRQPSAWRRCLSTAACLSSRGENARARVERISRSRRLRPRRSDTDSSAACCRRSSASPDSGLVLGLRFPEYLTFGELRPLYRLSVPARRHSPDARDRLPLRRCQRLSCVRTRRWP